MRFSAREDIEAPIDYVYGKIIDFGGFERSAMRRGIDVERKDSLAGFEVGANWHVGFKFRGKSRAADLTLQKVDHPNGVDIGFTSGGVEGSTNIELVPLSPARTRLIIRLDMAPRTLAARLLLQSLKLAKNNLTQKFKTRIADFAEDIETSYTGV